MKVINKYKELSKMKRVVLSTLIAAIFATGAVAQFTNATNTDNNCPEGQVPTAQGCVPKTEDAPIGDGTPETPNTSEPSSGGGSESAPAPQQPSTPSCAE